jgi:hypothetical protein
VCEAITSQPVKTIAGFTAGVWLALLVLGVCMFGSSVGWMVSYAEKFNHCAGGAAFLKHRRADFNPPQIGYR